MFIDLVQSDICGEFFRNFQDLKKKSINVTFKTPKEQWDASADKGVCCQAGQSGF